MMLPIKHINRLLEANMKKIDVFSPFYYKTNLKEHSVIKDAYLESILANYNYNPEHSHDWNVHTNYMWRDTLPNTFDWWTSIEIYRTYVNEFIEDYFRQPLDWRIDGEPWYTAYGRGQKADWHDHMPADFSAVHFLKFNPEVHNPIVFTNPDLISSRLHGTYKSHLVNNLGTCAKQSYYKHQFTPEIEEGDFIIFPSQMLHLVNPNESNELRVTIAFNFNLLV